MLLKSLCVDTTELGTVTRYWFSDEAGNMYAVCTDGAVLDCEGNPVSQTTARDVAYSLDLMIEQLETNAGTAGDLVMAAICQIALQGSPSEATYAALTQAEQTDLMHRFASDGKTDWNKYLAFDVCIDELSYKM